MVIPSSMQITSSRLTISSTVIRLKSNLCTRDKIVGSTLWGSVVAKIKIACGGGSSSVLSRALNACLVSMCTSSMMKTLYVPLWGGTQIGRASCRERVEVSVVEAI